MFKNIWNEFRATQETLDEKNAFNKDNIDGSTQIDPDGAIQEKLMTSAERAKAMQKQADAAKKKAAAQAAKAGNKVEDNTNDQEDDGDGMDKVQPKALKKKFKDRKDKDIDNDGDVDSSDEYLHNRRKTVSKKVDENDDEYADDKKKKKKVIGKEKEGDIEVNPKMDKGGMKESIRDRLMSVLSENDRAKHYKGAMKPETPEDKLSGKGAKDMMNQPVEVNDDEKKGHDDASKAGKVTKAAGARSGGDNISKGDKKIVKGGTPVQGAKGIKSTMEAYKEMYDEKFTTEEVKEIGEDVDKAVSALKKKTRDNNWHNKNGKVAHPYLNHNTVRKKLDKHGMNKVPHHTPTPGSAP